MVYLVKYSCKRWSVCILVRHCMTKESATSEKWNGLVLCFHSLGVCVTAFIIVWDCCDYHTVHDNLSQIGKFFLLFIRR